MSEHFSKSICPSCGYAMNATSDVEGQAKPTPGDFGVCMKCAQLFCFDANMELQPIDTSQAPSELWDSLDRLRCVIKTFHTARQGSEQ